jgi:hypothetical protein
MIDRITPRGGNDSFRRLDILWPASSTRARRHKPVCPYPVFGHVPATDADRQPLLAIKFPEGKPNPRWSGRCSAEACQTSRARRHAQFGHPASPSKSRRTSHLAPLAFSSSYKLQPFIPHQRKPRLPIVRLPDPYCTMIVCANLRQAHRISTVQRPPATLVPHSRSSETPTVRMRTCARSQSSLHLMPTCWSAQGKSTHESFAEASHASVEAGALCCSQIYTCMPQGM